MTDEPDSRRRPHGSRRPCSGGWSSISGTRSDVQNIDLMNLAGFCRNCLANWYREAAADAGNRDDQGGSARAHLRHALRGMAGAPPERGRRRDARRLREEPAAPADSSDALDPRRGGEQAAVAKAARGRVQAVVEVDDDDDVVVFVEDDGEVIRRLKMSIGSSEWTKIVVPVSPHQSPIARRAMKSSMRWPKSASRPNLKVTR